MKNYSKILTTLGIALMFFFASTLNGNCQNGYNVPLGGGVAAEFAPDAIGTYYLNYSATGFYPWQLTVRVYWQSDTYPGWREFYVRNYLYVNYASGSVTLYSGTDTMFVTGLNFGQILLPQQELGHSLRSVWIKKVGVLYLNDILPPFYLLNFNMLMYN